jgi:hypothetical protein
VKASEGSRNDYPRSQGVSNNRAEATGVAGLAGFTTRFNDNSNGWTPGGMTGQAHKPVDLIIKPIGSGGSSDALNQRGSIGQWILADVKTGELLEEPVTVCFATA